MYYICDTDAVVVMEKHIHRKLEQMNISIFEGGDFILDDKCREIEHLDNPTKSGDIEHNFLSEFTKFFNKVVS